MSTNVFEKFEASFSISGTTATDFQKPYDASAPAGIVNNGISVDAQFLPPGQTDWNAWAITHPCFYYVPYTLATVSSNQQALPTVGQSATWKVRWSPKSALQTGIWNWRVRVIDGNGTNYQAQPQFTITAPVRHGFVRVGLSEPKRFEYTDGTNFNFIGINGDNNATLASKYTGIGLDIQRVWFSNYLPLGTGQGDNNNSPWSPINASNYLTPASSGSPSPFSIHLTGGTHAAAVFSFVANSATTQAFRSSRRSTTYQFSFWTKTTGLSGTGKVTLKLAGFASSTTIDTVLASPTATLVTTTAGSAPTVWTQFTGSYTTSSTEDFLGNAGAFVYVALESSTTGTAEVAGLSYQENLGGGNFGPNQWDITALAMDTYSQVASAMIDSLVADAESKGITLKAVLEDKGETAWKYLNATGTIASNAGGDLGNITAMTMSGSTVSVTVSGTTSGLTAGVTWVSHTGTSFGFTGQWLVATVPDSTHYTFVSTASGQTASPLGTVQVVNFYNAPNTSQTGWYHRALARYLCARWGYSTAIHSWEHVNEGDGGAAQQAFTDAFASYIHSIDVHGHLVSTSTAVGVHTTFWASMPNVDFADFHGYEDSGELGAVDWILPVGSWTWVTDSTFPGAIQMDCTTTQSWFLAVVLQESGVWTVSCDLNTLATTGGTFGFSFGAGEAAAQLLAAGQNWTTKSATFTPSSNPYTVNILLGAGTHSGGTGKIRNLSISSPSGKRLVTLLGDGTFPQQTDLSRDIAAFHTAYDRYATGNRGYPSNAGQGVYGKPMVRGEWSPGNTLSNTYLAWVASDTNMVWLHTHLFSQLAPGGLGELWWNLATNPIDTNNGWGTFTPYATFLSGLPLNNGHYVDIGATQASQTNGAVIVVGQKDTTNNKAHLWVRHNAFTAYNAVNAPTTWLPGGVPGQILTGSVAFTGLASGSYSVAVHEFSAAGTRTISAASVNSVSGTVSLNLASLQSTTTDVAFSLSPLGVSVTSLPEILVFRDSTAGGTLKTLLTPAFLSGHVRALASPFASATAPAVTELNATDAPGVYVVSYDAIANGDAVGVVDGGSALTQASDRYCRVVLLRENPLIIFDLDATLTGNPTGSTTIPWSVTFADSTAGGALKTGLTPAFLNAHVVKLSNGTTLTAPALTEINATDNPGEYGWNWDPVTNGDCVGVIDGGASLTQASDRYQVVALTREAALLVARIDTQASLITHGGGGRRAQLVTIR